MGVSKRRFDWQAVSPRYSPKRYRGRYLKETLDLGTKQVYEVEIVSREGELRSVLVSVAPLLNDEGVYNGVLGIARDITERKHLERQVQNS